MIDIFVDLPASAQVASVFPRCRCYRFSPEIDQFVLGQLHLSHPAHADCLNPAGHLLASFTLLAFALKLCFILSVRLANTLAEGLLSMPALQASIIVGFSLIVNDVDSTTALIAVLASRANIAPTGELAAVH